MSIRVKPSISFGARPYWFRFLYLVGASVAINLLGLLFTQQIGWSLLFFDMVGTAVASLLSGAAAGMMVALLTGVIGAVVLGNSAYYIFSFVNIVGALLWAILPRTGRNIFGANMFDVSGGKTYRRAVKDILKLGIVVGIGTALTAFFIQTYVLGVKAHFSDIPTPDWGGGTATALNNASMIAAILKIVAIPIKYANDIILFLASLATNVPDKIISTACAFILVLAYKTLPNYANQKKAIRKEMTLKSAVIIDNRRLLILLCVIPLASMPIFVYRQNSDASHAGLMLMATIVISVISIIDVAYLRSVDRNIEYNGTDEHLFYHVPNNFHLGKHKSAFEDIMKLAAIFVSGISFFIAGLSHSSACLRSDSLEAINSCGSLYYLAAINILIITGFRYVAVIAIRWSDRL